MIQKTLVSIIAMEVQPRLVSRSIYDKRKTCVVCGSLATNEG